MKRKLLCLALALAMLFTLAACGEEAPESAETSQTPEISQIPENSENENTEPGETGTPDAQSSEEPEQEKPEETEEPDADIDTPAAPPAASTAPAEPDKPEQGEASNGAGASEGALSLLEGAWALYPEEERFAAAGGDYSEEHMVDGGPGIYDVSDAQQLNSVFGVPEDCAGMIDGAASLMHMMNMNTFTCGAFHIKSGEDAEAFALALKDNILQRHWMCGFPDKVVIYSVGEYVVSAFGNAGMLDMFFAKLAETNTSAALLYDEPIE